MVGLLGLLLVGPALASGVLAAHPSLAPTLSVKATAGEVRPTLAPATTPPGHDPVAAVATVGVGGLPQFAAYDSFHQDVYVPNWANNNVSVVNGTAVTATIVAGVIPFSATFDPVTHLVYIVNEGSNNVTVINGTHVVANIHVGTTPQFATYEAVNGWIYVSNSGSANVSVINRTSLVGTVAVGTDPSRVVATGLGGSGGGGGGGGGWAPVRTSAGPPNVTLYVPNSGSDTVTVIGGTTGLSVLGTVAVGSDPQFAAWDPNNVWLYVPNNHSGNVSILTSTTPYSVLLTVAVGTNPWSATFDGLTGEVLIVNYGSGTVSVLGNDASVVVATVPVGTGPEFITQDSAVLGLLLVPNTGSGNVTVLRNTTELGSIAAGGEPIFGTYDAANRYVYMQNFATANITVISPAVQVEFHAVGLPPGTVWGVGLGSPPVNQTNTTVGGAGTIKFLTAPGAIRFGFSAPAKFGVAHVTGSGSPSQNGANISGHAVLTVRFGAIEHLTFNETGLPTGAAWGVAITPSFPSGGSHPQSANSTSASIGFTVVQGPWKYSVSNRPSTFLAVPHKGAVGVPAHNVTKVIRFKAVAEKVVFSETGLTAGTSWGVNITGPVNYTLTTTRATIVVSLTNGSYSYRFANETTALPSPANGTLSVTAPHATVTVATHYTPKPVAASPSLVEVPGVAGVTRPAARAAAP